MREEDGNYSLDENHSYYYQVQCKLNVCEIDICYLVVWSPSEIACIEVTSDAIFFRNCLPIADTFVTDVLLPEIIVQLFTRKTKSLSEAGVLNTNNTCKVYCICKKSDGCSEIMIFCENENCQNGQWFHLTCIKMTKKQILKGAWYCSQCRKDYMTILPIIASKVCMILTW